jgi:septum formation topological specificity factor MinE
MPVSLDKVQVRMERGDNVSTLEVEVEIPNEVPTRLKLAVNG